MNHARREQLKLLIETFLAERKEAKIGSKSSVETAKFDQSDSVDGSAAVASSTKKIAKGKQSDAASKYDLYVWIDDAAKRASQIKQVTHIVKTAHPDAKGTQIYSEPENLPETEYLSSRHLRQFTPDAVGNAAALDVYAFLTRQFEGQSLLELFENKDIDLLAVVSKDSAAAKSIAEKFAAVKSGSKNLSSHSLAKQVYWLVGNDPANDKDFHLLSPLFPSSLMHAIYEQIQQHRFDSKEEHKAKQQKKFSDKLVHDYPDLAIRKFGGSKPQNISILNSKRRGDNLLLPSLPPSWRATAVPIPRGSRSIFERFGHKKEVRNIVQELKLFLEKDPTPNQETRSKRDRLVRDILSEFVDYAARIQELDSGWSSDKDCQIPDAEKILLDPGRAELDETFAQVKDQGEWKKDLAASFGRWLNQALSGKLLFGDVEFIFWSEIFDQHDTKTIALV